MKIVTNSNIAIISLIVIIFICTFKYTEVQREKTQLLIKDSIIYTEKLKELHLKNLKLQYEMDSILMIPYDSIREVIRIKYEKDSVFISDANASELDSCIRANW